MALRAAQRGRASETLLTDLIYDQQLVNNSDAADRCMKLGAVILESPSRPRVGFTATVTSSTVSVDPRVLAQSIDRRGV